MSTYFIIRSGEDGVNITKYSEDELEEFFQECTEYGEDQDCFVKDFPQDDWSKKRERICNENYLEENEMILIKGEIIVPEKVEVVKKYKI